EVVVATKLLIVFDTACDDMTDVVRRVLHISCVRKARAAQIAHGLPVEQTLRQGGGPHGRSWTDHVTQPNDRQTIPVRLGATYQLGLGLRFRFDVSIYIQVWRSGASRLLFHCVAKDGQCAYLD